MRVLICGGGVIGASIAYFLSRRGVEAIVIERTGHRLRRVRQVGRLPGARLVRRQPARGAGAAQLCAARRASPRRSAATGAIAASTTYGGCRERAAGARADARQRRRLAVGRRGTSTGASARRTTTAQVHPAQFTAGMMRAARGAGRAAAARARSPASCRGTTGQRHRRRGRRRDDRGRCGRDRHGSVVDPGRAVAAAAGRCSA